MSKRTELDFLRKGQIPVDLVLKHMEDYHPDIYKEYSDLIQNSFKFISKKVKIILLVGLTSINITCIYFLFSEIPWVETLGVLGGTLTTLATLMVILTPTKRISYEDRKKGDLILKNYRLLYAETEDIVIQKIIKTINIIKTSLGKDSTPRERKELIEVLYQDALYDSDKEIISYALQLINETQKNSLFI
jgi:uncharacterized transporter YbjL